MSKSQQAAAPAPQPVHGQFPWQGLTQELGEQNAAAPPPPRPKGEFPWQLSVEVGGNEGPQIGAVQEIAPPGVHADYLFG